MGEDPRAPKKTHPRRETRVPERRRERIARLGGMLAGMAGETAVEALRRVAGRGTGEGMVLSRANARRLADTLGDLRGAAMKLGQLLSMHGEDLVPGHLAEILGALRSQGAFMPEAQLRGVLVRELGPEWRDRFAEFDFEPIAAASIGQVHAAEAADGRDVAVKIQYPGVARSIDSDVDSLSALLRLLRLLPAGFDITRLTAELKRELEREADYEREAASTEQFGALLVGDPDVFVPRVHHDLSTRHVLTTDRVRGLPIDDLRSPEHPAERKDRIGSKLLQIVFREIFEFRRVQTDPNFANYLYEPKRDRIALLDFGAVRKLSVRFSEGYRALIRASVAGDDAKILQAGREIGLLTGRESRTALRTFVELCDLGGEPLRRDEPYDFARSDLPLRARDLGQQAFLNGGLGQPPTDALLLHRKLAGTYLLLAHIGARVECRPLFERHVELPRGRGARHG